MTATATALRQLRGCIFTPVTATELRVHGIGGPSAESVLGCDATATSWRSEPEARSSVRHCPGEESVRAYLWSPLTSGSRTFALWPLLLPYTLVNVAGWMAPRGQRRASLHRAAAVVVGLGTTMATVVWFLLAALTIWGDAADRLLLPGGRPTKLFTAAAASAAVALGLLVLSATFAARGYERFRPPSWKDPRPWQGPWGAAMGSRLDDEHFYDNASDHEIRWWVHVVTAAVTWLGIISWIVVVAGTDDAARVLGRALAIAAALQALSIAVMVCVALPSDGADRRLGRRLLGPATATIGIMLLGGLVLSGMIMIVGTEAMPTGPGAVLFDVYGWALLGGFACAAASAANALMHPTPAEQRATRALVASTMARIRARLATVLSRIDVMAVGLVSAFAVAGIAAVAMRWDELYDNSWDLTESLPVRLAQSTFALLIGFVFLNLWKSRASPTALRNIGNIWDILTFWPRTFHPLAVRPYAERAVPELQHILRAMPRRGPLVITAHSQGSILMYAAIRPFVTETTDGPRCTLPPFALVTFGSPLSTIYAAVFPHYVDSVEIERTRAAVAGTWTNYFRVTDHVGRAVFISDTAAITAWLNDSPAPDRPVIDGEAGVRGHNDYWQEPVIRQAVERAATDLEART